MKCFLFTVLPFGLSSAPYLFTKLSKPILTSRRCKGGGTNSIMAKINSLTVRADLTRYGCVINEEKSLWEPVQVITCLGTVFDTYQGLISVTERRVSKLKSSIDLLRKDNCKILKVRDEASVVGQVISLTPCVGSVAKIMTRAQYTVVNQKQSWDSQVELSKEAFDELTFWIDNDSLNFRCLSNRLLDLSILTHQITLVVLLLKKNSTSCIVAREGVNARELSAKLNTAFICDFFSGVKRGQSVSVFFSPLVVFVLLFDRLLLGFCALVFSCVVK